MAGDNIKWRRGWIGTPDGARTTTSKKVRRANSALLHGKKGVKGQAVFRYDRPGGKKRSLVRAVVGFVAKCALCVAAVGALLVAAALVISAVADGASAGFVNIRDFISRGSEYLVFGAVGVAAILTLGIVVKVVRVLVRSGANRRSQSQPASASSYPSSAWQASGQRLGERAQAHQPAPATPADWYADPRDRSQQRYWDGHRWTPHTSRPRTAVALPADWYPDPSDASTWRYWDGSKWTEHLRPRDGFSHSPAASTHQEPRISMSNAEWQSHVRAWLRAGVIHPELWRRLSNATIQDADEVTLVAQRRMEELSPQDGAERVRLMLEANPSLRDQAALMDFLNAFGGDGRDALRIGRRTTPKGQVRR